MEELIFKGNKINYRIEGEGEAVFLMHGYLENLEIWDEFAAELSRNYRVIRMDLPGHGKSQVIQHTHNMELMAEAARQVLDENQVGSCTMIGHSMGGYVTLAFVALYPELVKRYSLFHSHPFADSQQVKQNRVKAIEKIREGKKREIIDHHIPKTFADDNVQAFSGKVDWARMMVSDTPEEGIVANLKGMMERPDRSGMVKNSAKPFLLVAGKKDNFIDYQTVIPKIELPEKGYLVTLDHSGHMGFLEEKEKSVAVVEEFMQKE